MMDGAELRPFAVEYFKSTGEEVRVYEDRARRLETVGLDYTVWLEAELEKARKK
jgi:hypothetical protein